MGRARFHPDGRPGRRRPRKQMLVGGYPVRIADERPKTLGKRPARTPATESDDAG